MKSKITRVFIRAIVAILLAAGCLALLSSSARADELIFRDDFICYDTLYSFNSAYCGGIDVCLDSAGFFSQINSATVTVSGIRGYQYNKFDPTGNQFRPVTVFMPDTVSLDTIWQQNVRFYCFGNDFGNTAGVGTVANRGA
ncbi:MAG: hypothetical protein OEW00_14860, partial [candidate division Zixibacteria bacterium]|nr:hypothetical protein [candidate division Zixibacteria bacterium]